MSSINCFVGQYEYYMYVDSSIRANCSDTVHDRRKVKAADNQDTRLRDTDSRVAGEGKDREEK